MTKKNKVEKINGKLYRECTASKAQLLHRQMKKLVVNQDRIDELQANRAVMEAELTELQAIEE